MLHLDRGRVQSVAERHLLADLRCDAVRLGRARLSAQLRDDRAQSTLRRRDPQRKRDRRLADAALAGDDDQLTFEQGSAQTSPSQ
jgi:hypothetical protein